MAQIVRTARFVADIRRLIVFDLAAKNPYAAGRYLGLIDQALRATAAFPLSKQEHRHLGEGIRKIVVEPYVILYRPQGNQLIALRFLHGRQDITQRLLDPGA